jgi:3-oxoacyl-[acyl-carrier protein] reductase
MDVRDKTVLVAGGAGNLGSAVVADLRARGARIAVLDIREPGDRTPGDVFAPADAADEQSVAAALASIVAACGNVSALVNCTGLIHSETLVNVMDPQRRRHRVESWDSVLRSNLTATFVTGAVVAEHMAATRTKGVIVNFSSIAARGNPGQTAYAAAKAGIEALTAVWARELGPLGIRAVAIAPGFVDVPSTQAALNESALGELKRRTPLRRFATAREIAAAVAFAIENDFITGSTIGVDGGLVI